MGMRELVWLVRTAVNRWIEDRAASMGAAIAYYTVFSLAPILILVIAIAGLAFGRRAAEGALFGEIAGLVGQESAGAVQVMLRSASDTTSGVIATLVSLATLLLAATGVFGELQAALNLIWRSEPPKSMPVWNLVKVRLVSLSLIAAIGFLLLVSLVVSAALTAFSDYLDRILPGLPAVLRALHLTTAFGFTTVFFAMVFKILPDAKVRWRDVWIGAAVTSFLFTIGKYLISLYIGSSSVASTYGAAGALVVVLVWVYYSAQILLFGAEFTKVWHDRETARQAKRAMAPIERRASA